MSSVALDVIGFLWSDERGSRRMWAVGVQLVAENETGYILVKA